VTKPEAVAAGYYLFTALLSDGGKTAGRSEVVHIYDKLTTTVTFGFVAGDFTQPVDTSPPEAVSGE
jgi:hypothetical protein